MVAELVQELTRQLVKTRRRGGCKTEHAGTTNGPEHELGERDSEPVGGLADDDDDSEWTDEDEDAEPDPTPHLRARAHGAGRPS